MSLPLHIAHCNLVLEFVFIYAASLYAACLYMVRAFCCEFVYYMRGELGVCMRHDFIRDYCFCCNGFVVDKNTKTLNLP